MLNKANGNKIKVALDSFGRILQKHKYITAFCTILLFAAAFAFISSDNPKPSEAAITPPPSAIRNLDTSGLTVANYLQAAPSDLTAFDSKVSSGGTVTIANRGELLAFAQRVNEGNDFAGRSFVLGANIDLQGGKPTYSRTNINPTTDDYAVSGNVANIWTPIGNAANKFRGSFDGQGYTISNMTSISNKITGQLDSLTFNTLTDYNNFLAAVVAAGGADAYYRNLYGYAESYAGLFGYVENGTIKNVTMANPNAVAVQYSYIMINRPYLAPGATQSRVFYAGFAQAGAVVGKTNGAIINNHATNAVIASGSRDSFAGGIAGSVNSPDTVGNTAITIQNSTASGNIVAAGISNDAQSGQAGGIVGGLGKPTLTTTLTISGSSFTGGEILSNQMAGGIAAAFYGNLAGTVAAFTSLNVNANVLSTGYQYNGQGGGIIGSIGAGTVSFVDCHVDISTGLYSNNQAGGLMSGGSILAGLSVTDSSVNGNINGSSQIGGLFGGFNLNGGNFTVNNVTLSGVVTGSGQIGGMVGGAGIYGTVSINNFNLTGNVETGGRGKWAGFSEAFMFRVTLRSQIAN